MTNRALRIVLSDKPVAYHPILAKALGDAAAALFLSQLLYWDSTLKDGREWFWKTQAEMEEETGLTRREQETARRILVEEGIIEVRRGGSPCRLWYRIAFDKLESKLESLTNSVCTERTNQFGGNVQTSLAETYKLVCTKRTNSISENTQESTSESTVGADEKISSAPAPRKSGRRKKKEVHPLAELYRSHMGILPNAVQLEMIVNTVKDVPLFARCLREWRLRGYSPTNAKGVLDWYSTGGPPAQGGAARKNSDEPAGYSGIREFLERVNDG